MPTASNVSAGKAKIGGAVYRAALGTTLPTAPEAQLDAAFINMGYVSDAGLVNSGAISSTAIKAWGGDTVLNIQTDKVDTFTFTLIETLDPNVLKAVYGEDNVSGALATGITVDVGSDEQEEACWVFNVTMRDGVAKRIVVPDGKITNIADITYSDSAAVGYNITLTAYPYTGYNGKTHREYMKKG